MKSIIIKTVGIIVGLSVLMGAPAIFSLAQILMTK